MVVHKCNICNYETIYPTNYKNHLTDESKTQTHRTLLIFWVASLIVKSLY